MLSAVTSKKLIPTRCL